MLELRLKNLVAILAMPLNTSIPGNGAKNLLHVNHLASIRVAQVIIVTRVKYRPQGLMFKNLLGTVIRISQFYPSYSVVKIGIYLK